MTPQAAPAVSVLLSVFNAELYLGETLDTLLAQTFGEFELVAIDDASSDGSRALLESRAARDSRLRLLVNDRNIGLPASLNRGLDACRAEIVARADADDVYDARYLETQLALLRSKPAAGVVSSAFHKIDGDGRLLNSFLPPLDDAAIRAELLFTNCMTHPTTVFRKSIVQAAGGYDESYWTAQDYELWARLRARTRFANSPASLVGYRRHDGALARRRGEAGERLSLSVTQRLLSEYLGWTLSVHDAALLRGIYRGHAPLSLEQAQHGVRLLSAVRRQATRNEEPAVRRALAKRLAAGLLEAAQAGASADRRVSRTLLGCAWHTDPTLLANRTAVKLAARLHLPAPVVSRLRRASRVQP
jgi:hypothetical protein